LNAGQRLIVVVFAIHLVSGCGALPPFVKPSPTLIPVAVQVLGPNESFERLAEPSDPLVSRARAIEIAQTGLTGTLATASAEYGRLRTPWVGTESGRLAWFVTLDGLAPPAASGVQPTDRRRTFMFVDAENGRPLIAVSEGAGP
jgi:hypothetical protein